MKRIILILLMVLSYLTAFSITKTATTTGNWSVSSNWNPSGEPTASDSVIIPAGITITSNQNGQSCYALVVYGTFIANKNNFTVTNIYNYGTVTSNGNNFQSTGNIINTGTFDSNGNNFSVNIITNSGTMTIDGVGFTYNIIHGVVTVNGINIPIKLVSFKANCVNDKIIFNWTTASEIDNNYFTIEQSFDVTNFTEIKNIKGAGNSQKLKNYTTNINKINGYSYFRLKQTDYDGDFTYSDIIVVECLDKLNLSIIRQGNSILINADEDVIVKLIDLNGSVLKTVKTKSIQLELKGVYLIEIISDDEMRCIKL